MRKICRVFTLSVILLIIVNFPAFAERREVSVTYDNDDWIVLSWQYADGDKLFRTWDGRNWTEVGFTPPAVGEQATVTSDVYVPYYANIYFEIRKQAYTSADRSISDSQNFVTIPVYPPLKNAHSEFSGRTDLCASCHVTHSAQGAKLVNAVNNTELCKICHGPGATGSRYDVWNGIQRTGDTNTPYKKTAGGPVLAGPTDATWDNKSVTSTHVDAGQGPYPGSNIERLLTKQFSCTDCHSPHANYNGYRLLTGYNNKPVWAWAYNPTGLQQEQIYYEDFSNSPCFTCHVLFEAGAGSGHTVYSTDDPYRGSLNMYRHTAETTDVITWNSGAANPLIQLPLEKDRQIFCLTCHYPHGTTVGGLVYSAYDRNLNGQYTDYTTALKRMDNSAMCQNCHKK